MIFSNKHIKNKSFYIYAIVQKIEKEVNNVKRKGFIKKALIYTVIGATVAGNTMPALAYTNSIAGVNETQDVSTDDTAECEVYAQLGTDFRVIIPKKLTLSGSTKKGAYTVDVEGDIGGTDVIKVVPEESFTLTSTGLASQTATVNQDKTQWSWNEILPDSKTIGNGSIEASGITAGAWNGSFWFNISIEEDTESESGGTEAQHTLTLSDYNVKMGTDDSVQVNAFLDGVKANDEVSWSSDNENIKVTNGLVETTAGAQVGDTATVTVTANNTENLSAMANVLSDLGIVTYASAAEDLSIDFIVTIVDIEYSVEELNLKAGESIDVTARIIPDTVTGTVSWSQTAVSGINLVKNGNTVTVKIASDMEAGKSYNLVATYGDYSKTLKINIVSDEAHTHSYTGTVTTEATCTEDGVKTFTCECGDSYTEVIKATGHNYVDGVCTECGENEKEVASSAELADWNYVLNTTDNTVTLRNYKGSDTDVIVYGAYELDGTVYDTVINSTNSQVTELLVGNYLTTVESIVFKNGVTATSLVYPFGCGISGYENTALKYIDVSGIDVSQVTSGGSTFNGCQALEEIKGLETWDTSNMTDMNNMFAECLSLKSIKGISNWNTSNVTNMKRMFTECPELIEIDDLSSWDTSNVTDMYEMFEQCFKLTEIKGLETWDTSNVTDMRYMFGFCYALSDLSGVEHWNVENVTTMAQMFQNCFSITSLDLSNWNTSKVTNMCQMFYMNNGTSNLESINLTGWDTSNVTDMRYMFGFCSKLTELDLSSFNTRKVTQKTGIFYKCTNLTKIYVGSDWTIPSNTTNLFVDCGTSSVTRK